MFLFLIPLMLGFVLAGASAFTATYSRRWGESGGRIATSILRNLLGIPLWLLGLYLAWIQPAAPFFSPSRMTVALGWLLIIAGSVPVLWGHVQLGWRTHMPSVRDTLVRRGFYAHVRHPIYSGGLLILIGLALIKPTLTVALASMLAGVFFVAQAILEEIDLLQRLPAYKEYMDEVPRFIPRLRRSSRPWAVVIFYVGLTLLFTLWTSLRHELTSPGINFFLFSFPLLLGFALVGASAFTAAYSRWWGEPRGELTTSILRNFLGIPLGILGLILAWLQPAPALFIAGPLAKSLGWLLIVAGSVPFIWGHVVLGSPTGWPSVRDSLMRQSLYAHVRHPIYAGGLLMFVGGAFLKPTITVGVACALGFIWLVIQARLEEIDLVQRLPEYREYMKQVPRFLPRLWARKTGADRPSRGLTPRHA
jgi:protein-S-isoprenylcysteine O-methyltransferase Ste14